MGRRLTPKDDPPDLSAMLTHCLAVADQADLAITALHICAAIDQLHREVAAGQGPDGAKLKRGNPAGKIGRMEKYGGKAAPVKVPKQAGCSQSHGRLRSTRPKH